MSEHLLANCRAISVDLIIKYVLLYILIKTSTIIAMKIFFFSKTLFFISYKDIHYVKKNVFKKVKIFYNNT